jgi:uncharacterized membrane protein
MTLIRAIAAAIIFSVGIVFFVKLFIAPFAWLNLIIALVCFALAYCIWPSKKKGQREEDNWLLDIMEIMIELPLELFFWTFRAAGHLVRKSDIDI